MVMMKLVYITILIIWRMYPLTCAQYDQKNQTEIAVVAKPGCKSECGNVSIPYPFGMEDPKCYGSSAFEIECRNNKNKDVAYLKYINLEVILIDIVKGTIWIKNPIYSDGNCERKGGGIIKLGEGPFVYSQDYNSFVGVGCGKAAFMYLKSSIASVCVSMCYDNTENDKNKTDVASCRGAGCCETSLPPYLSEFNISIGTERDVEEVYTRSLNLECAHALIRADYNKFPYDEMNRSYWAPTLAELENVNDVPAVLEWEITNRSLLMDLDLAGDVGYHCNQTNVTSSQHPGWRCTCNDAFQGNPYIQRGCQAKPIDPSDNKKKSRPNWAVIGVSSSLGTIILFLTLWCLHKVVRKKMAKKRKEKFFKQNGGLLLEQRLYSGEVNIDKLFSLKDLEKATDYFNINRILGKGGQGTVYKGMLVDGNIVAVKKFKVNGKVEEFINEFVILSQINHRNVVKLLGCCLETETPLLVYEFIPNGNLYEYLHGQNEELSMTWAMRLRIATEIAGALFYLHSVASQPIYHRDIKSTNILLDGKYKTKVADFGASRMVSIEATHLTTAVQGTFGYLDPEYFHTSQFTDKSDVYSFGVVLVELLTGKKPISSMKQQESKSLASYFVLCVEENRLFDIIDERVMNEGEKEHIHIVSNLARRCLELNGKKRPTMKEVTLELESIQKPEKQSNAKEYHEELEFAGFEDCQFWTTYSTTSNSDSIASTLEIMPILIK